MVAAAVTWTPSSAAGPLALAHSDYPHGAHIAVVAATNAAADRYLAPVHRSTFERLHRLDGSGWLQFGTWTFRTGSGTSSETHQTVFGYGVNLFSSAARAANALKDVKIPTKRYRVAHLNGRRFISTDAAQTLVFVFFQYRTAEIEAYYQYTGVAPRATAKSLRHTFATQLSHLAHLARLYTQHPPLPTATRVPPTPAPTDTPVPTDTATPTSTSVPAPTDTPTSLPTATSLPTSIPSPTPTSTPMPTPTPVNYAVTASMPQKTFSPGEAAVVNAHVSLNGQPAAGVKIVASYAFPNGAKQCEAVTDSAGNASCSVLVTPGNGGQTIVVNVEAIAPGGYTAETTTSFRAGG